MERVLYFLNERDRRNVDIDPDTGEETSNMVSGYFIPLAPVENNQRVLVHHLDKNLINENISNAAILLDKLVCNLPNSISSLDEANPALITNIVRREKLKDIPTFDASEDVVRTLYFIEN